MKRAPASVAPPDHVWVRMAPYNGVVLGWHTSYTTAVAVCCPGEVLVRYDLAAPDTVALMDGDRVVAVVENFQWSSEVEPGAYTFRNAPKKLPAKRGRR